MPEFRLCHSQGGCISREDAAKITANTTRREVRKLMRSRAFKQWKRENTKRSRPTASSIGPFLLALLVGLFFVFRMTRSSGGGTEEPHTQTLPVDTGTWDDLSTELESVKQENFLLSAEIQRLQSIQPPVLNGTVEVYDFEEHPEEPPSWISTPLLILAVLAIALMSNVYWKVVPHSLRKQFTLIEEKLQGQNKSTKRQYEQLQHTYQELVEEKSLTQSKLSRAVRTISQLECDVKHANKEGERYHQMTRNFWKNSCPRVSSSRPEPQPVLLKINVTAQSKEGTPSEDWKARCLLAEQEARALKRDNSRLGEAVSRLESVKDELNSKCKVLTSKINDRDPFADPRVQQKLASMEEKIQNERKERAALAQEVQGLKGELAKAERVTSKGKKEFSAVKEELRVVACQKEELETTCQDLRTEESERHKELVAAKEQMAILTSQNENLQTVCRQLRIERDTRSQADAGTSENSGSEISEIERRLLSTIAKHQHFTDIINTMKQAEGKK